MLVALIAAGSVVGQRLLDGSSNTSFASTTAIGGAFVQPPLSAAQVYSLHHLVSHMQYKQLASLYVAHMSLDEELGQLIMVEYNDTSYTPDLDMMVNKLHAWRRHHVRIPDADSSTDRARYRTNASTRKNSAPHFNRRRGRDCPSSDKYLSTTPLGPFRLPERQSSLCSPARTLGRTRSQSYRHQRKPCARCGTLRLFPTPPDQITRTYGFTTDSVIQYAGPYMQAMQSDGIIACIKHYPGLGDASTDAHFGLPVVNRTRDQLYSVELAPFKHFIQSQNKLDNPGMIMPTDVLMPAIDPKMPAELSHTFMTDILRHQFGYDGVVLTDALYMQGISQTWTMPQAAVLALNAGDDMLLGPTGTDQMLDMLNGLKAALQNGTLSKARVDEAATRIITLKMQYHLMPAIAPK